MLLYSAFNRRTRALLAASSNGANFSRDTVMRVARHARMYLARQARQ
jgi:hypothetical protein